MDSRKVFKVRFKSNGLTITEFIVAKTTIEALRHCSSDNVLSVVELSGNVTVVES